MLDKRTEETGGGSVETVFADVREGKPPVTDELISLTLRSKDLIRFMIDAPSDEASEPYEAKTLIDSFRDIDSGKNLGSNADLTENPSLDNKAKEASSTPFQCSDGTCRVRFAPSRDIFPTGTNPLPPLDELKFPMFRDVILTTEYCPRLL